MATEQALIDVEPRLAAAATVYAAVYAAKLSAGGSEKAASNMAETAVKNFFEFAAYADEKGAC